MLPVVVSSSTKFSRQAASCRDNISKRVSLFPSRKLRGISIQQTSKSRELGASSCEYVSEWSSSRRSGFLRAYFVASGHAQRRGNYSQVLLSRSTLHSVQKFLFSSLFLWKYCTLILSLKENLNYSSRFHQQNGVS